MKHTPLRPLRNFFAPFAFILALTFLGCKEGQSAPAGTRVMTYNIEWFSEDATPERIQNLKKVIEETQPSIIGFQEVQSKAAMRQILDSDWVVGMADDPDQHQEVGVAVKAPFKLLRTEWLFPGEALNFAYPDRRDGLRAEIESPSGKRFSVYVVHMKSRRGGDATPQGYSGRNETDRQREQACAMLAGYLSGRPDETKIVLGDFNDTPDDRSLNILESGNLLAKGGPSAWTQPLLINLTEPLYRQDFVSIGLARAYLGQPIEPKMTGAMKSNEDTRGKEHRFPQDVPVTQTLFDQILVSPNLQAKVSETFIHSSKFSLQGKSGRTERTDKGVNYIEKPTRASDHLPVVIEVDLN